MSTKITFVSLLYGISLVFGQTTPSPIQTTLDTCCQCTEQSNERGCDADPVCEELICTAINPNCCRRRWGGQCADAAISQCGNFETCCGCLNSQNSPLCQFDADCTETVCTRDPYCCTNEWDNNCALNANATCFNKEPPICCGCTLSLPWPGCSIDADCETVVCNADPFCCGLDEEGNRDWSARWDGQCQQEAQAVCNGESLVTPSPTTTTSPPRVTDTTFSSTRTSRLRTTETRAPRTTTKAPRTTETTRTGGTGTGEPRTTETRAPRTTTKEPRTTETRPRTTATNGRRTTETRAPRTTTRGPRTTDTTRTRETDRTTRRAEVDGDRIQNLREFEFNDFRE